MLEHPPSRWPLLDAWRGLAIVWMTVFHLCFDLNHFGWWRQDFLTDPFWTWQRTAIVSGFLLCAGMGQACASSSAVPWGRFFRRWIQVAGAAALVSLGSWWMYPSSFIYFGVLHGMAVMLILTRWLSAWGNLPLLLLAALLVSSKWTYPAAAMVGWIPLDWERLLNQPGWNALGLVTRLPVTQDYVPVLPWLGVMLLGLVAGRWLIAHRAAVDARFSLRGRVWQGLAFLGQHSLSYYLLHQPVLLGLLSAVAWLAGGRGA